MKLIADLAKLKLLSSLFPPFIPFKYMPFDSRMDKVFTEAEKFVKAIVGDDAPAGAVQEIMNEVKAYFAGKQSDADEISTKAPSSSRPADPWEDAPRQTTIADGVHAKMHDAVEEVIKKKEEILKEELTALLGSLPDPMELAKHAFVICEPYRGRDIEWHVYNHTVLIGFIGPFLAEADEQDDPDRVKMEVSLQVFKPTEVGPEVTEALALIKSFETASTRARGYFRGFMRNHLEGKSHLS